MRFFLILAGREAFHRRLVRRNQQKILQRYCVLKWNCAILLNVVGKEEDNTIEKRLNLKKVLTSSSQADILGFVAKKTSIFEN
ncbi:hypothetical protein AAV35_012470 [Salimicrobium jeotgali]|uniref:Uncharacterized protein n=1 Tax=Salimicrobium jeotgali TaxID=1230341 RepID=A0AAC8PV99_9BACI|nr:hypothetical protein AAV35_012470 [Salimicrobium jeotgali]